MPGTVVDRERPPSRPWVPPEAAAGVPLPGRVAHRPGAVVLAVTGGPACGHRATEALGKLVWPPWSG